PASRSPSRPAASLRPWHLLQHTGSCHPATSAIMTCQSGLCQVAGLNPTAASLLGFLHQGPMAGWDLAQLVETTIGDFWNVTRSQIYRELRSLQDIGLVEAGEAGVRERLPYSITDAGREAVS